MANQTIQVSRAPRNRPHETTADLRQDFSALMAKTPRDSKFRAAFARAKLCTAHTDPNFGLAARDGAVGDLSAKAKAVPTHPVQAMEYSTTIQKGYRERRTRNGHAVS